MQKVLVKLGFTEIETYIYLYLTEEGPKKGRDIGDALNLYSQQLYSTLKKLQSNGVVNASPEYPRRFSAIMFDKVLDLLIKAKEEQHKALQASKEELLSTWRSMTEKDDEKS